MKKNGGKHISKSNFLNCASVGGLLLKSLILLIIPYAYLMFCGLVFDKLLKWYQMTGFIFYSLMALYAVALVLIVVMIVRFVKGKKRKS